ncbi:MAG: glycosyltransferase [Candidatus Eisenbacteria bacterium]
MSGPSWDDGLPSAPDPRADRMRGETIVCFGWTEWTPGTQTWNQVLRRLAYRNRVIYVPPPLERTEVFGSRFAPELGRRGLRHREDHLYIYRFSRLLPNFYKPPRLVRSIESMRLRALRRAVDSLGGKRPILYIIHPKFRSPYVGGLGEKLVLYHMLDEYSGYAGANRERVQREEGDLLARTDVAIASSPSLAERKSGPGRPVHFVPNGVDFDLFSAAAGSDLPVPDDLAAVPPGPRVGYLGRICDKLDFHILREAAVRLPHAQFVFIGPVLVVSRETRDLFEEWAGLPNVHILGAKEMDDLPAYVASFDVGILPYGVDDASVHRYPLKLHEYQAAGIPVVSVPLPCFSGFAGTVRTALTTGDWVAALREAVEPGTEEDRRRRIETARLHDWNRVVLRIENLIREKLSSGQP